MFVCVFVRVRVRSSEASREEEEESVQGREGSSRLALQTDGERGVNGHDSSSGSAPFTSSRSIRLVIETFRTRAVREAGRSPEERWDAGEAARSGEQQPGGGTNKEALSRS